MSNYKKFSNFNSKKIRNSNFLPSFNNNNIMSQTFYNNKPTNFFFKGKEIKFSIRFTTGQSLHVSGYPNQNFQTVLDKALKENNLENFKNKIGIAIFEARKIIPDQTLSENKIKEGSIILLVIKNEEKNTIDTKKSLSDSISTKASISDLILDLNDLNDINEMILLNLYNKYINRVRNSQLISSMRNSKKNLCDGKNECTHIHTYKHNHGLVLLFSNRDWICDICRSSYPKNQSTYYCSICDFDICHKCIGISKKYTLNQTSYQQTELKTFDFPCHEHKLIYCRTSRNNNHETNWICDLCFRNYENKIWSFYCTNCDYDICLSCAKKFMPKDEFINKIGIKVDEHQHNLVYIVSNRNWICNLCRGEYPNFIPTYYCSKCDFDVCRTCMNKLSDEIKFPLFYKGKKEDCFIKIIDDCKFHFHPLIYCITSRGSERKTNWICDKCKGHYNDSEWSFYCTICDFDLCFNCYKYSNLKKNKFNF